MHKRSTAMKNFLPGLARLLLGSSLLLTALAYAQDELAAREEAAQVIATNFMQQMSGALARELANGPEQAAAVCRDLAPQIAGTLSRRNGWQITRVGTRVRNPLLGLPDAWEREVLNEFAARAANGEDLALMSFGEVVDNAGNPEYRYLKAIPLGPNCVLCHGTADQIPDSVESSLAQFYPQDRAIGYTIGELRGAVSIRQPLDIPLAADAAAE
jgi:hypothetical protein